MIPVGADPCIFHVIYRPIDASELRDNKFLQNYCIPLFSVFVCGRGRVRSSWQRQGGKEEGAMAAKENSAEAATLSSLMDRLQVRPPYLDTDSLVSNACDKVIEDEGKSMLAKEEAKLEQKIIRTILSGRSDSLKPNSGQAVAVGDHQICVGCQEKAEAGYRVWEWHGHIMIYSDEKGYVPEYIYGNYFQRVAGQQGRDDDGDDDDDDFDRENPVSRIPGLRDLIANVDDINARILCRNINLAAKR